ncbi:type II toxin-antitoxin system HipA family toxin [Sinomonas sp. P10A9]|uniref:Type II toxin-antitoxin system HipA family toxin n=1 Tax=Sinomonas puerhi TaxID=3238584 RepID=A0AB39L2C5_9MICC
MSHDFSALRFVTEADVYKGGTLAGRLWRDERARIHFAYREEYIGSGGRPVARTLPVGPEAVGPLHGLPAFFAGLLPEGHRLTVLRSAAKTSLDDELTLLLAVGSEVPGDVQVVPARTLPAEPQPLADLDHEAVDFSTLADALDLHGLPGVQDKVSASMLSAPVASAGHRWILKLDPPDTPHLVLNEALHLAAARGLRVPVASAHVVRDTHGAPGLLVSRFDRVKDDGAWRRLELEDGAQLLGVLPAAKYSVAAEELVAGVASVCRAPAVAVRNLYLQFLFAWLTGNGDLHAKNVAVLTDGRGHAAVAPMFDLPSTVLYGDMTMALPIAGRTRGIRERHWAEFADAVGLPAKAAASARTLALGAAARADLSELPFAGSPLNRALRELRQRRSELE